MLYNVKRKCFELRTGAADEDGNVEDCRNLSTWLYEFGTSSDADVQSIANDFTDVVKGPKMSADIKSITKPTKKKKNEDGNIDTLFFFNRLVNVFPELKDTMNQERIVFGKVRFATVSKEVIAPKCDALAKQGGESFDKLCTVFNDMYEDGDIEVRGTILHGIFNNLSGEAMEKISEKFSDELKKLYKHSKKLKNKNIKPNKEKKRSQVVAAALENANKNAGK